jgi:hypothetical protein
VEGGGTSSSNWATLDLADDGSGAVSGAMTSLDGNPGPWPLVGTLDCAGHLQGTISWASPIDISGNLSATGNEIAMGLWSIPGSLSGSFSLGRVVRSASATAATTVTTDGGGGATTAEPVQTTVTSPDPGNLSIEIASAPNPVISGYQIANQMVHIVAPTATSAAPLVIEFLIDQTALAGTAPTGVRVLRNGALVPDCTAAGAVPDPCVSSRVDVGGDARVAVYTSAASIWAFGLAVPSHTSVYSGPEARLLYVDAVFLHATDLPSTQRIAAMFMVFLGGLVQANPPTLGPDVGSGPLSVTSTYSIAEESLVQSTATQFGTDPASLQRIGVKLLAFLITLGG